MRVVSYLFLVLIAMTVAAPGQDTNFPTGPQYLMNYGSPQFLHSISTPSLSWQSPALEVGASNATSGVSAGAANYTIDTLPEPAPPADLFPTYYGVPRISEVEISLRGNGAESAVEQRLPASILNVGTWQITTNQDLRERGYGISVVEAAAYWKTHTRRATHLYGNGDIDRLHEGN
ncbi:MAG: hypothetical protein WB562_11270 [Candidatus Sulfotelmatobacter sp.]